MILSLIIFEMVLFFLLLYFLFTKNKKFTYLIIAFFLATLWNTSKLMPKEFLFFNISPFIIFNILLLLLLLLFFQNKVKHYLLQVMFICSVIAVTVSNQKSIIPFYIIYELVLLTGIALLYVTKRNVFPKNFLNLQYLLAVLTALFLLFSTVTSSLYFQHLFVLFLVFRGGLFPFWIIEKDLFYQNPLGYGAYYLFKQIPLIVLLSSVDSALVLEIINCFSLVSLIVAGLFIYGIKNHKQLFSSIMYISFSLLYLTITLSLNLQQIILAISSSVFVTMLCCYLFNYHKNKVQIINLKTFDFDVYKGMPLFFFIVLFVFLLPFPFLPFVTLEFNLLKKVFSDYNLVMMILLLIGMFLYKITIVRVLANFLSRRIYGKKISD